MMLDNRGRKSERKGVASLRVLKVLVFVLVALSLFQVSSFAYMTLVRSNEGNFIIAGAAIQPDGAPFSGMIKGGASGEYVIDPADLVPTGAEGSMAYSYLSAGGFDIRAFDIQLVGVNPAKVEAAWYGSDGDLADSVGMSPASRAANGAYSLNLANSQALPAWEMFVEGEYRVVILLDGEVYAEIVVTVTVDKAELTKAVGDLKNLRDALIQADGEEYESSISEVQGAISKGEAALADKTTQALVDGLVEELRQLLIDIPYPQRELPTPPEPTLAPEPPTPVQPEPTEEPDPVTEPTEEPETVETNEPEE